MFNDLQLIYEDVISLNSDFLKLNNLYDNTDIHFNINIKELKYECVYSEYAHNNYDELYLEAEQVKNSSKRNIIGKMIDSIINFIKKIRVKILRLFGKNEKADKIKSTMVVEVDTHDEEIKAIEKGNNIFTNLINKVINGTATKKDADNAEKEYKSILGVIGGIIGIGTVSGAAVAHKKGWKISDLFKKRNNIMNKYEAESKKDENMLNKAKESTNQQNMSEETIDANKKIVDRYQQFVNDKSKVYTKVGTDINSAVSNTSSKKDETKVQQGSSKSSDNRFDFLDEKIEKNDVKLLRDMIGSICYINRNFARDDFDAAIKYVESKGIKLKEPYDSKPELILNKKDLSECTEDDFEDAVFELKENFCTERINEVKKIGKYVYGPGGKAKKNDTKKTTDSSKKDKTGSGESSKSIEKEKPSREVQSKNNDTTKKETQKNNNDVSNKKESKIHKPEETENPDKKEKNSHVESSKAETENPDKKEKNSHVESSKEETENPDKKEKNSHVESSKAETEKYNGHSHDEIAPLQGDYKSKIYGNVHEISSPFIGNELTSEEKEIAKKLYDKSKNETLTYGDVDQIEKLHNKLRDNSSSSFSCSKKLSTLLTDPDFTQHLTHEEKIKLEEIDNRAKNKTTIQSDNTYVRNLFNTTYNKLSSDAKKRRREKNKSDKKTKSTKTSKNETDQSKDSQVESDNSKKTQDDISNKKNKCADFKNQPSDVKSLVKDAHILMSTVKDFVKTYFKIRIKSGGYDFYLLDEKQGEEILRHVGLYEQGSFIGRLDAGNKKYEAAINDVINYSEYVLKFKDKYSSKEFYKAKGQESKYDDDDYESEDEDVEEVYEEIEEKLKKVKKQLPALKNVMFESSTDNLINDILFIFENFF